MASQRGWLGMPHCGEDVTKPPNSTEVCNERVERILKYGTWRVSILCFAGAFLRLTVLGKSRIQHATDGPASLFAATELAQLTWAQVLFT